MQHFEEKLYSKTVGGVKFHFLPHWSKSLKYPRNSFKMSLNINTAHLNIKRNTYVHLNCQTDFYLCFRDQCAAAWKSPETVKTDLEFGISLEGKKHYCITE